MTKFQIAAGGKALCRIVAGEDVFAPAAQALCTYLKKHQSHLHNLKVL